MECLHLSGVSLSLKLLLNGLHLPAGPMKKFPDYNLSNF